MTRWKNIIFGEKMPSKDSPRYRERYEKEVEVGRKFARVTRIDKVAGYIQAFASKHTIVFLSIVFTVVLGCFTMNIYHLAKAYHSNEQKESATERQERIIQKRFNRVIDTINTERNGYTK